jgi:molecular chaperone GrpE (heat shock protein)
MNWLTRIKSLFNTEEKKTEQEPSQEPEDALRPIGTSFYLQTKKIKLISENLEKHGIDLFNLKEDLSVVQSSLRDEWDRTLEERNALTQEYRRLVVRILDLLDEFYVEPDKIPQVSLMHYKKYIRNALLETLKREGITQIQVEKGETFDPRIHEMVEKVEEKGCNEEKVVKTLVPGYIQEGRIVRKPKVAVYISKKVPNDNVKNEVLEKEE